MKVTEDDCNYKCYEFETAQHILKHFWRMTCKRRLLPGMDRNWVWFHC